MPDPTVLDDYIAARRAESTRIPAERRRRLDVLARHLVDRLPSQTAHAIPVVFICTHNSRRSHLGAIWARLAADRAGLSGHVETFSGGTEATAFAPGAVAALRRAGFDIQVEPQRDNPVYTVRATADTAPLRCWSKTYDDPTIPSSGFVAVLVCSDADAACPVVAGAATRITIPYQDPKRHDGTACETAAYDACCAQIAREMLYTFERVADLRA